MELDDLEKVPDTQVLRGPGLLKTLPLQTKLFDNVSSSGSESSRASAPFSDVVYTVEVESKRKAKKFFGKDFYTAFSFSHEFKSAIEDVKKQSILENPDYLKDESSVIADNSENDEDALVHSSAEGAEKKLQEVEFLKFPNIDFEVEMKEEEEENGKKRSKEKEKKNKRMEMIWQDGDEVVFDTMSGYWRLLSVYQEFRISPPWYDAYAEGQKHWLETKPIPMEVMDKSREKCLTWLSKYFEG